MSHEALGPQFREAQVRAHIKGIHGYEYGGEETVEELEEYLKRRGETLDQFHREVHESARREPYIGPMRDESVEYFHGDIPPHGEQDLGGG